MTAPLAKAPGAPRPAAPGAGTAPMAGGAATAALPKATVKLQQTQPMARSPMAAAPPSAPIKRAAAADSQQFYDEDKDPEAGLVPLSVICLIFSVVLMAIQMLGSDKVTSSRPGEPSPIMVPADEKVSWESYNAATQKWQNNFKSTLPEIPQ